MFLDMLTDSGTNAMSDNQVAAMFRADDAYAGSQSFTRLLKAVQDVLGKEFLLPVHQGRAAENIICRTFIKPGQIVPMNYHFTTALAHITENGGKIAELLCDDALEIQSTNPFKGNIDIHNWKMHSRSFGSENIPFIGWRPHEFNRGPTFFYHNFQQVREIANRHESC
ncbi:MAG: beta-eliminating lyase-related protein [Butyricimonas faecihominis]